jgi:hypothetical protein
VSPFSHIGDAHCYCTSLSSPSDTTCSLSSEGHSRSNNSLSLSLSLSLEGHSLSLLRSPCRPTPFTASPPSAAHALRTALSLPRKSVLHQVGRPRARRRKGPTDVNSCVIQSRRLLRVTSPSGSAPSSALSPWPRRRLRSSSSATSPRRKSPSRWKLITHFY